MFRRSSQFVPRMVTVLLLLLLAGACGDDGGGTEPLDATTVDSQGCDAWNAASAQEKAGLVSDLGYSGDNPAFPDAVSLIVEGVDSFCTGPDAEPDLGLGGAISGTALAIGIQPTP